MGAVWMRLRAETRARWRAMLGLAVLLAIMAGAATAAAVGARRTETAYPRFLERYRSVDTGVATGRHERGEEVFAVAAGLPHVERTFRFSIYLGTVRAPSGEAATFPDVFFLAEHERRPGGRFLKVVSGRMSDPSAADEAMVNYAMADRLKIEPGDVVDLTLVPAEGSDETEPQDTTLRITGVYASAGEFEDSAGAGLTTSFRMTPAFHRRWRHLHFAGEDELGIRLRRGEADLPAFVAGLNRALEARDLADGLDSSLAGTSEQTPGVQDLNRVPAVALWLLCGFLGITTFAVLSQLLAREVRIGTRDSSALRALGASGGQLVLTALLRSWIVIAAGAGLSVGVAFLLSPLTPVGLARIAEPDPGFTLDPLVIALAFVTTFVLLSAAAVVPAWAAARRTAAPHDAWERARPTFLGNRVAMAPLGLSARSGLRMAVESGRGDRAVPLRTAVLGTTIAVGALATALTFATSLRHLLAEPILAGYTWDAGAIADGFDRESQAENFRRLERAVRDRFPSAAIWRGTAFLGVLVDGIALGGYASDGPPPSIIDGRSPRAPDEIAVDPRTMRQLGKEPGDRVQVSAFFEPGETSPPVPMRLVGTFAVPRIAFVGDNPGQGAAITPAGVSYVQPDATYAEAVYIDFPLGVDFESGLDDFRAAAAEAFAIVSRKQSATVGNVERLSVMPIVLATATGILGIATLAYALTTTIRQRRRDLAILKTLGFVGRQVRATVAWESTVLMLASLAFGLPIGIAAGRWGWRLFAEQLQVVPVPVVSAAVIAAVAGGAIVLGNAVAAFPARVAARTEPAVVLRTE